MRRKNKMSIFIAIDCGKFNTKVSAYNSETEKVLQFRQRTKICDGTFDDDMFDKGTYITQVDGGNVYKIGNVNFIKYCSNIGCNGSKG